MTDGTSQSAINGEGGGEPVFQDIKPDFAVTSDGRPVVSVTETMAGKASEYDTAAMDVIKALTKDGLPVSVDLLKEWQAISESVSNGGLPDQEGKAQMDALLAKVTGKQ